MENVNGTAAVDDMRVGIVVSTYNDFVTNKLLDGAVGALRAAGLGESQILVATVPGAFEVPQAKEAPDEPKPSSFEGLSALKNRIKK